jgi:hypothetical protein
MKIWIAVMIDHYGGDMLDCWCDFNEYDGLKVFYSKEDAEKFAKEHETNRYAASCRIEEVEVEV